MQTLIALFRGINVGGNNILPMKSLSNLLEANGYQNVTTYIQSGNVIFNADSANITSIAELVNKEFGFRPKVMLLDLDEAQKALVSCPYLTIDGEEPDGKTLHFYFCEPAPELTSEITGKLNKLCADTEQFALIKSIFYLYAPKGIGRSALASKVEACLGVDTTARNLNTVRKVLLMAESQQYQG